MLTKIFVDQEAIRNNQQKEIPELPVLRVVRFSDDGEKFYAINAFQAEINGPSQVCYNPEASLLGEARVWVDTRAEVVLGFSHAQAKGNPL